MAHPADRPPPTSTHRYLVLRELTSFAELITSTSPDRSSGGTWNRSVSLPWIFHRQFSPPAAPALYKPPSRLLQSSPLTANFIDILPLLIQLRPVYVQQLAIQHVYRSSCHRCRQASRPYGVSACVDGQVTSPIYVNTVLTVYR